MNIFFWVLAALILFFIVVMIIDVNRFVTVPYSITSPKIKNAQRFVVLADLHNKQFGEKNGKLIKKIRSLSPDGILLAGDMITATKGAQMQDTLQFLTALKEEYPLFYGEGNHEYRLELYPEVYGDMLAELQKGLSECGEKVMKNSHIDLEESKITIYGLSMDRIYYKRFKKFPMKREYLTGLLGEADPRRFNILLAHNPDYFPEYDDWGADLVLSGHVHGGLMRLPVLGGVVSPAIHLFPKYDGGLYQGKKGKMILSRGLGTHTLPIRIFNPGELVVVDLLPAGEKSIRH